jgi:autotransporter adhesin
MLHSGMSRAQAFGWKANATGAQAVAVGNQAQATGDNSTSLGNGANASAANSTAIGRNALASGANSTAIGQGACTAGFANSVAIGTGTVNTAANQVNVGGRTISGVANGVLATDAVNMGQLNAAIGDITALENSVAGLFNENRHQDKEIGKATEGVAMALALDSPSIPAGATFAISGGIGGYNGKHALATAISAAVGEMATVSAGFGYGLSTHEIGYRAGFQVAF